MKVSGYPQLQAYGMSRVQKEALIARRTDETDVQERIASNSNNRLVLLNLSLNENLDEDVVQTLFDRDLPYLTSRLENMGHKKSGFLGL